MAGSGRPSTCVTPRARQSATGLRFGYAVPGAVVALAIIAVPAWQLFQQEQAAAGDLDQALSRAAGYDAFLPKPIVWSRLRRAARRPAVGSKQAVGQR